MGSPLRMFQQASSCSHHLTLTRPAAPAGLKCMVSLQSNSRHLLGWLMSHMDPERDGIFLAASKAFDQATGKVRPAQQRQAAAAG